MNQIEANSTETEPKINHDEKFEGAGETKTDQVQPPEEQEPHAIKTYFLGVGQREVADTKLASQVEVKRFDPHDILDVQTKMFEAEENVIGQQIEGRPLDEQVGIAEKTMQKTDAEMKDLQPLMDFFEGKKNRIVSVSGIGKVQEKLTEKGMSAENTFEIPNDAKYFLINEGEDEIAISEILKEQNYTIDAIPDKTGNKVGFIAKKGEAALAFLYTNEAPKVPESSGAQTATPDTVADQAA